MHDLAGMIAGLKRPKLLVRAARFGVDGYDRAARLPRLLGVPAAPRVGDAILGLLSVEADLDTQRRGHHALYSVARHVEVLTALMGEARLLRPDPAAAVT